MSEPVNAVPYDPGWPSLFALVCSRAEAFLGSRVQAVEHVGSTAVPGLDAKPVIDLIVEVREVQSADHYIYPLEGMGYSYWAENPNPDRILFVKFVDADRPSRTHNLHVVEMVEISGTIGSSFVTTSAPTLRRSGIRATQTRPYQPLPRRPRRVHRGQDGLRLHGGRVGESLAGVGSGAARCEATRQRILCQ